jgi:NitT/TauT family transport system permease protein
MGRGTESAAMAGSVRTRGKRRHPLARIRSSLSTPWRIGLGVGGVLAILLLWQLAAVLYDRSIVASPVDTWNATTSMWRDGTLWEDFVASGQRIAFGYSISIVLGIIFGVAIGTFASAEGFFEPQFGFLRYIPAAALTPLLLLTLGLGESPKITLIVIGTVFFNILMIADVARSVPRELLNASYTLGASRRTVVRRVVFRYSLPGIIDVARINLAAGWLMLVVAELLAADSGLAFRIVRAQRFHAVDSMYALLIIFGLIGLFSDLALRALRHFSAKWARP